MNYGVLFRVRGDFALFTRPDLKAERVSYLIPPASALRGIAEAIHLPGVDRADDPEKPPVCWDIRKVAVLNPLPVQLASVRRNELGATLSFDKRGEPVPCYVEDERQQRASLLLRDVDYVVHAALAPPPGKPDIPARIVAKHLEIFKRRLKRGEQKFQPYLGCREFPAQCDYVPKTSWEEYKRRAASANPGRRELGRMLREIIYRKIPAKNGEAVQWKADKRLWFDAEINDGVVVFPKLAEDAK